MRYDCGSKFGYLEAIVDFGLAHEEFGSLMKVRVGTLFQEVLSFEWQKRR